MNVENSESRSLSSTKITNNTRLWFFPRTFDTRSIKAFFFVSLFLGFVTGDCCRQYRCNYQQRLLKWFQDSLYGYMSKFIKLFDWVSLFLRVSAACFCIFVFWALSLRLRHSNIIITSHLASLFSAVFFFNCQLDHKFFE